MLLTNFIHLMFLITARVGYLPENCQIWAFYSFIEVIFGRMDEPENTWCDVVSKEFRNVNTTLNCNF